MKLLTLSIFSVLGMLAHAQTYVSYTPMSNASGVATLTTSLNPDNAVSGSTYIFNDWNNSGKLWTNAGKLINVQNLNFNAYNAQFSSKISKDSVFNFHDIYKVEVNGRQFESINDRFYEVLYEFKNDRMLLKDYTVKVKPELDKITNIVVGPGKFLIEDFLYIYNDHNLERFKPNKRNILELVDSKKAQVLKHAKSHRLSFKNENDIVELFKYSDTL